MFWFVLPQLIKKIEKSQNLVFSASRLMIAKRWTEIVKTCSTPRLSVYNNTVFSLLSEWFSSLWTFALYGRFLPAKNSPRASLSMCGISTQILFSGAVLLRAVGDNQLCSRLFSSLITSFVQDTKGGGGDLVSIGAWRFLSVSFLIFSHFCYTLWNRLLNVPCYRNGLVIAVYVKGWQQPLKYMRPRDKSTSTSSSSQRSTIASCWRWSVLKN